MSTLREVAQAAGTTSGAQPWRAHQNIAGVDNLVDIAVGRPVTFVVAHTDEKDSGEVLAAITQHIATFDPLRVMLMLDLIRDLVGDHCESHEEPEVGCTTCTAVALLTAQVTP